MVRWNGSEVLQKLGLVIICNKAWRTKMYLAFLILMIAVASVSTSAIFVDDLNETWELGINSSYWTIGCFIDSAETLVQCTPSTQVSLTNVNQIEGTQSLEFIGNDVGDVSGAGFYSNDIQVDVNTMMLLDLDESSVITGTVLVDKSGNQNLTYANSGVNQQVGGDGRLNGAVAFDGIDDEASTSGLFDPPDIGSLSFWAKVESFTAAQRMFGSDEEFEVRVSGIGGVNFDIFGELVSFTFIETGTWFHYAVTWNVNTGFVELYVDGTLVDSGFGATFGSDPGTDILYLGSSEGLNNADVVIDQFMITNDIITASEAVVLAEHRVHDAFVDLDLDTTGRTNITVNVGRQCINMESIELDSFAVKISDDNFATEDFIIQYPVGNLALENVTHVIPEQYWNNPNVTIRFLQKADNPSDTCVIDNIYFDTFQKAIFDYQIISQGVNIVEPNQWAENEWKIFTDLNVITNPFCELFDVNGSQVSNLGVSMSVTGEDGILVGRWFADSNVVTIGHNYEIVCSAFFDGVYVEGIEQYIFVVKPASFWDNILSLITNIFITLLQVQTQVNETLNIVQNLEGAVNVVPQAIESYIGETINPMAVLTVGQVPDNNATCKLSVYYPNATKWINLTNMSSIGDDGIYKTNITFPNIMGNYQALAVCSGGSLLGDVRGSATWKIGDGVRMSSIT